MASKSCTGVLRCLNITKRMQSNYLRYLTRSNNLQIESRELVKKICSVRERTLAGLGYSVPRRNCSCRFVSNSLEDSGVNVKHDPVSKLFFLDVDGLGRAYIEYEREDQLIKLLHTEVPHAFSGRGYGKMLAKEALEYVAKNDYQLEINCEYVRNYVSKYAPKYIKYLK